MRTNTLAVVAGVLVARGLWLLRGLEDSPDDIPPLLMIVGVAFLCYFAALIVLRRSSADLHWLWIVAIAVVVHVAPFRGRPVWDRDAYRYHWDGKLLAQGVNPFRYAPGDHELWDCRDEFWEPMQYKQVKTIYPPVTQWLLALTYHLDPTPRRVFVLGIVLNLLCLWPLLLLMRARGVPDKWLVIYAWNPLMAMEFAMGGHLDPVSIFFLLWTLYFLQHGRRHLSGLPLALAVMAKTQVVFAAPIILWRAWGWAALIFVVTCAVLMVPFANAQFGDLVSGSMAYLGNWEHNSGLFAVVHWLASLVAGPDSGMLARMITMLLLIAVLSWLTFERGDLVLRVGLALLTVLLLSPTFFPWYASWVLPFACLLPNLTLPAMTFLLLIPYVHHLDPALASWLRLPEFVLMYAIGAAEYLLWRRRGWRFLSS